MKVIHVAALAAGAALLAACTPAPEASIKKDCVRLGMMQQVVSGGEAEQKKACGCFGDKLKADMSKANLKALAKTLKQSKTENEFETKARENGLDESDSMVLMGAAKSCAAA